jgi:Protein of unknown function (DUF3040)
MVLTSAERRRLDLLAGELAQDNPRLAHALTGRWYRLRRLARTLARPVTHQRALGYVAVLLSAAALSLLVVGALLRHPALIAAGVVAAINGPAIVLAVQVVQMRKRPHSAG